MSTLHYSLSQIFAQGLSAAIEFEEEQLTRHELCQIEAVGAGHLWVSMPRRGETFVPLPTETTVMLHVKRADGAFALRAQVVGRRLQPAPMLELAPLGEIVRRPPREYVRLRITLIPSYAAVLSDDGSALRLAATIINLSAGGVLLRTRQSLRIGQRVGLRLALPPPGDTVKAVVEVVRVDQRRAERGVFFDAGASFVEISDAARDQLITFIFRHQGRPRQEDSIPS